MYVKIKSKSTFVLKHDPSESNETTFEVARFLVFKLLPFHHTNLHADVSQNMVKIETSNVTARLILSPTRVFSHGPPKESC